MSERTTISTHVLDTALGKPAAGIAVELERVSANAERSIIAQHITNADGRVASLVGDETTLTPGSYRLVFDVGQYLMTTHQTGFYKAIEIGFEVSGTPQHYHVPLLLSPFGYSTYRGS